MQLPKSMAASIRFLCQVMRPDGDCPEDSRAKQPQKGDFYERLSGGVINFTGRPRPFSNSPRPTIGGSPKAGADGGPLAEAVVAAAKVAPASKTKK